MIDQNFIKQKAHEYIKELKNEKRYDFENNEKAYFSEDTVLIMLAHFSTLISHELIDDMGKYLKTEISQNISTLTEPLQNEIKNGIEKTKEIKKMLENLQQKGETMT